MPFKGHSYLSRFKAWHGHQPLLDTPGITAEGTGATNDAPVEDVFDRIDAFRKRMFEKYGTFSDSTPWIREDRKR